MAHNPLPTKCGQLIALGNTMYAGLNSLGTTLGITQVTPEAFQTALTAFTNADTAFNTARTNRGAASGTLIAAMQELQSWLLTVRTVLAGRLGLRWSEAWVEAGFTNASTQVPRKGEDQVGLAASLVNYFTAHPTYQVPSMDVTAAKGTDVQGAATAGQLAWTSSDVVAKTAKANRETKCAGLTKLMKDVMLALGIALGPLDPRWEQFGLNMPGANLTPGQPEEVQVFENPQGGINVLCAPVPLATRYRWRMKVDGVDAEFRLAVSSPTPDAIITEVRPGHVVDLFVQAVNGSLQGVASQVVRITVSAASAPGVALKPLLAQIAPAHSKGNGDGGRASAARDHGEAFAATR